MPQDKRLSYYQELGVQPDASMDDIRNAYRRLAKKYHPDLNKGDAASEQRFKRISEAYRVLSDPTQRLDYHKKEEVRQKAKAATQKRKQTAKKQESFAQVFKNVFKAGFGTAFTDDPKEIPRKGRDLQVDLELDTIELATGAKRTVRVTRTRICDSCGGRKLQPGKSAQQCNVCLGIGEVPTSKGGKTVFTTCPNCKGKGQVIRDRCMHCGGKGYTKKKAELTISIPQGSKNGQVLVLKGEGDIGFGGGESGDLLVKLTEKENPYFDAKGYNILYEYPLTIYQVMKGGEIEVPLKSGGKVKLNLSPGIRAGKILRVKGKGLPKKGGGYGDLLVKISYHFPNRLSARANDLLLQLTDLPEWNPKRDGDGFVRKEDT